MSKYYFQCINCSKVYEPKIPIYLCPECEKENTKDKPPKGILKTEYHYDRIWQKYKGKNLFENLMQKNFLDILPIESLENFPPLRIGQTPLYRYTGLEGEDFNFELFLKDDSQNPTFSYKDRASSLVSAIAREQSISTIATASTGNAGSSIAGICASQNQKAIVFVPASAPIAKLTQIILYGARFVPIEGTYDQAFDLCMEASKKFGWLNRNTAYNPFTIEGKKTASFELYHDLGQILPDRIFVPTGDGVIISGVYKGFEDLLLLGIIKKIPQIVAVQAQNSSNLVRNLDSSSFLSVSGSTVADSIAVDVPRNFYMAADFIKRFNGETCLVSDEEILTGAAKLARTTGIFSEPASAAAFAGFEKFKAAGKITKKEKVVVLLTGSGLKDIKAHEKRLNMPKPVKPNIDSFTKVFKNI
ncbi:MAG: threonine synthase [Bacteroidales bacterium]|nr:threonine synthase [Bacteroidales bacterium]